MSGKAITRVVTIFCALMAMQCRRSRKSSSPARMPHGCTRTTSSAVPASSWVTSPGMPLSDEGRAKALLYTSNLPSIYRAAVSARSPPESSSIDRWASESGASSMRRARCAPGSSAATTSEATSGSGWTGARIRRRMRCTWRGASRPGSGRATRSPRGSRTSRPRGSAEASASPAATTRPSPCISPGATIC